MKGNVRLREVCLDPARKIKIVSASCRNQQDGSLCSPEFPLWTADTTAERVKGGSTSPEDDA
jgi:hypothetical protein